MGRYREDHEVDFRELRDAVMCVVDAATDAGLWTIDRVHGASERIIFAAQDASHEALYWAFSRARFGR